jgi:hypothetical protein
MRTLRQDLRYGARMREVGNHAQLLLNGWTLTDTKQEVRGTPLGHASRELP